MITTHLYKICIAPMIGWTDRHYRYMMRLITQKTMLYTEMVSSNSIIHGPFRKLLKYSPVERPLTLQLGGNNPKDLGYCAKLAEELGFDGVNLNVGCPSKQVQKGEFGLSLMYKPALVAECIDAMKQSTHIPVSVKCRTGVDNHDSLDALEHFIDCVNMVNVDNVFIHARKGLLNGLSPKENRRIPELKYKKVYQIKVLFPEQFIGINGGVHSIEQAQKHLHNVDGVMIGRQAYHQPMLFQGVDQLFYQQPKSYLSPFEIFELMIPYIEKELKTNQVKLYHISRHLLNLFNGYSKAKSYRRALIKNTFKGNSDILEFKKVLAYIQ